MDRNEFHQELQKLLAGMTEEEAREVISRLNEKRSEVSGKAAERKAELSAMLSVNSSAQANVAAYVCLPESQKRSCILLRLKGCTLLSPLTVSRQLFPIREPLWLMKDGKLIPDEPKLTERIQSYKAKLLPVLVFEQPYGDPLPKGTNIDFGTGTPFRVIRESLAAPYYPLSGTICCSRTVSGWNDDLVRCCLEGYYRTLLNEIEARGKAPDWE